MFDRKIAVWQWVRGESSKRIFGFQPAVWLAIGRRCRTTGKSRLPRQTKIQSL
jgi:hypothetical protein